MPRSDDDRLFIKKPWRHYRRTYSTTEVRVGAVIVGLLLGLSAWVLWMGRHPDPELFAAAPAQTNRAPTMKVEHPLPDRLAARGWTADAVRAFGPDNLYEKINGREGYYKSFGFVALYFVALQAADDPGRSIDVEVYDQGEPANALGAFAGEIDPDAAPRVEDGGLVHYSSNALFMTRGRFYARALGSDRSDATMEALRHLQARFSQLPAAPLPWGFELLIGRLSFPPGRVAFSPENAFSFGFAENVYVATLEDDETQLFVTVAAAGGTETLRAAFQRGFEDYGEAGPPTDGIIFVTDRYLNRVSAALAEEPFVIGVKSAEDQAAARMHLERLQSVVAGLPPEERTAIVAAAAAGTETAAAEAPGSAAPPTDDAEEALEEAY